METFSVLDSLKCIILIFCLFTQYTQTIGSNFIDIPKGHFSCHQTKLSPPSPKKKRHIPIPIPSNFPELGYFKYFELVLPFIS